MAAQNVVRLEHQFGYLGFAISVMSICMAIALLYYIGVQIVHHLDLVIRIAPNLYDEITFIGNYMYI